MRAEPLDTVVMGGGLHGLSAAMHLAREGSRVVILERAWVGRYASGSTAAGVRTLNRHQAEMPLATEALDMWHHLRDLVGDDCAFIPGGQVRIAETSEAFATLQAKVEDWRSKGYRHAELMDRTEVRRLFPTVALHCVGGMIARREGSADPHRAIRAFRASAEKAGVRIFEKVVVNGVERAADTWRVLSDHGNFETPVIVNTTGAWGAETAAYFGENVPLRVDAPMMVVTERVAPFITSVVGIVGRKLSFKQTSQGTLLLGGGMLGHFDPTTRRAVADYAKIRQSAVNALAVFPALRNVRIVRVWAGVEGYTPDELPVIGPSVRAPGVFHAFGFSGHGFELVPVVGAVMTDLVRRGGTSRSITAFAVNRFAF